MKRDIYFEDRLIDRTDELQMDCLNTIGFTCDDAEKQENAQPMTAVSHLTGERISHFTHIHQNTEDLHRKQDMTRMLCRKVGGCIQRRMGIDTANAICNVSYEADQLRPGETNYHENFKKWLIRFQKEDLVGRCARTDVKGDREASSKTFHEKNNMGAQDEAEKKGKTQPYLIEGGSIL
jgi:aromatic ring hydroxylase